MTDFAAAKVQWAAETITLLDLVKTMQGASLCDATGDALLGLHIQAAGEAAERYIDDVIPLQAVTEQIDRAFSPVPLRASNVASLTSVTVDGADVTADYELFHDAGLAMITTSRTGETRPGALDQMIIVYSAGRDPLPTDLGYALARAAVVASQQAGGGQVKKESVVGIGSIEYDTGETDQIGVLPAATIGVLDRYARVGA